jgi:ATP-dependent helicase/nuclease subunit A
VVLLDTDGAAARAETMGVICEWPGEAPAPWRFAFLASESRPPACSAEALAVEQAARQREELNALYVAMTRARRQLVISSVQPANGNGASWWSRLLPWCTPLEAQADGLPQQQPSAHAEIQLLVLPTVRLERAAPASAAPDSAASRFGQAVHRLLELGEPAGGPFAPARLARIGREFGLDEPAAHQAAAMAQRILGGEGAWAWDVQAVDWQGNEVELAHEGELLRLDRLVRRRDSGEWWVLDYKSAGAPERQPELLAQMRRYCEAVRRAYPGAQVRAAFLTGQGRLVLL